MGINHVLLELWCLKKIDEHAHKPYPAFCTGTAAPDYPDDREPNFNCLRCKCPFVDFTTCEDTFCYINEKSEMEHGILFDYESYPDKVGRWKQMSVEAVDRTYDELMKDVKE